MKDLVHVCSSSMVANLGSVIIKLWQQVTAIFCEHQLVLSSLLSYVLSVGLVTWKANVPVI